jgi:hypothetical protein
LNSSAAQQNDAHHAFRDLREEEELEPLRPKDSPNKNKEEDSYLPILNKIQKPPFRAPDSSGF